jgi:single-strand DNA-binding protein
MNNITITGNLTNDPVQRTTKEGNPVTTISVADNYRNGVNYFDCVGWNQTAKFLAQYFRKGSGIIVTGEMQTNTWEQDGQKRYKQTVNISKVSFVPKASKADTQQAKTIQNLDEIDIDDIPNVPFE